MTTFNRILTSLRAAVDTRITYDHSDTSESANDIDWIRIIPFLALHVVCLAVFFVGVSTTAVLFAIAFYFIRMFSITAFYHRYFAHRAFKTNRFWQFIFAVMGVSAVQRGPLWWIAHHRKHHATADTPEDPHSPLQQGFWWSHIGWFLANKNHATHYDRIPDFARYPELIFLNRFDLIVPVLLAIGIVLLGHWLGQHAPQLHTNGWQLFIWGFCIATILDYHFTFAINSMAHLIGSRDYNTPDHSRNNFVLAIFTLGEGWHNNHHRFPGSAKQGLKWWQIDITYYILWVMEKLRIIHSLRKPE